MARQPDVRVYTREAERLLNQDINFRSWRRGRWNGGFLERIEVHSAKYNNATYRHGQPVDFGPLTPSMYLIPFYEKRYENSDALLLDMHGHGYFITDYRRLVGRLNHYDEILPLIGKGYVIEDFNSQVILVKREPGVMHEAIWVVNAHLLRAMTYRQLVTRLLNAKHGSSYRLVYGQGRNTLETLEARQRELLDERQQSINWDLEREVERLAKELVDQELRAHEEAACSVDVVSDPGVSSCVVATPTRRWFPKIEAPAFKKPPRAQSISPTMVLAYDDVGNPITAKDVAAEGRRTQPKGLPPDLVPEAPENCTDEQWEQLMLIEQIKFRRRHGL